MIAVEKLYQDLAAVQKKLNPLICVCDIEKQIEKIKEKTIDKTNFFYLRPLAVKDNFSIKGKKTTGASKMLADYVSPINATIIERIVELGGVIVAKTSLDELAMGGNNKSSYFGPVLNPFDEKRISGGSSGGSAVVVAQEIVDFALASDTGDSIRKPASYCGIVGVKPTYGLLSRYGVIPYASSLDSVGYFASDVKTAAAALGPLVGRDDTDMTSLNVAKQDYLTALNADLSDKKIAVLTNVVEHVKNPEVKVIFDKTVQKLKERGISITEISMDTDILRSIFPVYFIIANSEATANHANLDGLRFGLQLEGTSTDEVMLRSRSAGFSYSIKKRFVIGSYCLDQENQERLFKKAQKVRRVIADAFQAILSEYDAIIAPACGDFAPLLDEKTIDESSDSYLITENYMSYANFLGWPSMTLPMGKSAGLPLGLNITTAALQEQTMFDLALAVEQVADFKRWENE